MQAPRIRRLLVPVTLAVATTLISCAHTGDLWSDTPRSEAPARSGPDGAADKALAFAGWQADAPGVRRHIRVADLPAPPSGTDPEGSVASVVKVIDPPQGALPRVPDGFAVQVFASGLEQPRTLRVAPNGDLFVAETGSGHVLVYKAGSGGPSAKPEVFASNLDRPFGIVFQPPTDPRYVFVAAADRVVRYPYRVGDSKAKGPAEVVIDAIPTKRHWTRDLAISRDGQRLFLAVGSASNMAGGMPGMSPDEIRRHEATHGRGAAWGEETNRGVVRVFDPDGKAIHNYATGLRNCSGLVMQPRVDRLWCVMNERDHLGPHLVPDFLASIDEGGFYGWPWYYLGNNEDPARRGERPDLARLAKVPEVLIQAHSSALSAAFYEHDAFPAEYRGNAFVALHGSHSRPERTGYKVIRVPMNNGNPTGEYIDFMTGFVTDNESVWGRPAGVAVMRDGALMVSDDANGRIYRVTRR